VCSQAPAGTAARPSGEEAATSLAQRGASADGLALRTLAALAQAERHQADEPQAAFGFAS
jgi:hypothetical protein